MSNRSPYAEETPGQGAPAVARGDDLEALSRAVLAITERTEIHDVLQMVVESARTLVRADYAALGIADEYGRFSDFYTAGVSEEQRQRIGPLPRAHGLLGAVMTVRGSYRVDDVREDPRFSGWPSAHPDMSGFLGVPISDYGETLGAVYVAGDAGSRPFRDDDERLLSMLAAHAAIAISRARMFERHRELTLIEERSRIARDLHDAVAQKLFSLRLSAGAAKELIGRADVERVREEVAGVQQLAGQALDELRAVVSELRPASVAEDGVVPALRSHVEVIRRAYSKGVDGAGPVEITFTADCDGRCLRRPEAEDMLFRVAQEALHNALRHARPSRIEVDLTTPDEGAVLSISDDGIGFAGDPVSSGGRHLGIASMKERARQIGGRLRVNSEKGAGTTVRLEVPDA